MKKFLLFVAVVTMSTAQSQTNLYTQGFEDVGNLASEGWIITNQSSPLGASLWSQCGGTAIPPAHQGPTNSCTLVNFNSTTGVGTISNWLITSSLTVENNDVYSFYTKTPNNNFPDRLQFRLSDKGDSSVIPSSGPNDLGDFTILGIDVNPDWLTNYPTVWTQYSYTVTGLDGPTSMKAAFRYYVTNAGPSGTRSNIIGVDTYSVVRPALAVSDVGTKYGFKVYPTVADKTLDLSFDTGVKIRAVSIYDMSGRATGLVRSAVISENHFVVDVSSLASGTYLLNVITDKGQQAAKFIKK